MSSTQPNSFWLCHECGAQMRPIVRNGVNHCASCDGEFLEILDSNINPDPFHELPPAPPTRPTGREPSHQHYPQFPPGQGAATGSFMNSLFGNMFGSAVQGGNEGGNAGGNGPPSPGRGAGNQGGGSGGRSFTFNMPGGGRGQVMFGSFGGAQGGSPFGMGSGQGGLESFFPGFNPPQHGQPGPFQGRPLGPGDAMGPEELIQSLMSALTADNAMPQMQGIPGRANLGDYVMSQHGFDQILEQLMQAAGPQGPLPAPDVVIEGLPKFQLTEEALEKSQFKDCPVCKEDFTVGEEVKRIPCKHIFHPDCLDPWLKTNGSCPVCRFSLVPDEENRRPEQPNAPGSSANDAQPGSTQQEQQGGAFSAVTNVLQRLFGQAGTNSNPTSPTTEMDPYTSTNPYTSSAMDSSGATAPAEPAHPTSQPGNASNPQQTPQPASGVSAEQQDPPEVTLPTSIPDDYRARHRRRERGQQNLPPEDDLD